MDMAWLAGVGDKATEITYSVVAKRASTSVFAILFMRGHFAGTLFVSGHGTTSKNQVLALARVLDSRIQHAK
jgi:hypothetical protein